MLDRNLKPQSTRRHIVPCKISDAEWASEIVGTVGHRSSFEPPAEEAEVVGREQLAEVSEPDLCEPQGRVSGIAAGLVPMRSRPCAAYLIRDGASLVCFPRARTHR